MLFCSHYKNNKNDVFVKKVDLRKDRLEADWEFSSRILWFLPLLQDGWQPGKNVFSRCTHQVGMLPSLIFHVAVFKLSLKAGFFISIVAAVVGRDVTLGGNWDLLAGEGGRLGHRWNDVIIPFYNVALFKTSFLLVIVQDGPLWAFALLEEFAVDLLLLLGVGCLGDWRVKRDQLGAEVTVVRLSIELKY